MYVDIEVPQEGLFIKHQMTGEDMHAHHIVLLGPRLGQFEYQKKDFW